jgi:hypothetical protein
MRVHRSAGEQGGSRSADRESSALRARDDSGLGDTVMAGKHGEADWGADQIDLRLFYFRALLEGGRFFDSGTAAMFAATWKRA